MRSLLHDRVVARSFCITADIGCTSRLRIESEMASAYSSINHTDCSDGQPLETSRLNLNFAVGRGDVEGVRQRLAAGDHVDGLCGSILDDGACCVMSPLYRAALNADEEIIRILLEAGANPSGVNSSDGTSVLHACAEQGHVEVVRILLKAGAVVDCTCHLGRTPLLGAAYAGNHKVIEALLSANATVAMADSAGHNSLMAAAQQRHEACVRLLLQAGADPLKRQNGNGFSALHSGAIGGSVAVVRTLLEWGADANSTAYSGQSGGVSALHIAAERDNVDVIKALVGAFARIDHADTAGWTALRYAASHGCDSAVEALICARAKVDATDNIMITPLTAVAFAGDEKCVELLLKGGADVSRVGGTDRTTALYAASANGNDSVVSTLLRWGASVDTLDIQGRTALFAAASQGHAKTVKLLLDAGADPHIRDIENGTSLKHAVNLPTVKLLLEAGVSVTAVDSDGDTVLHCVGMRGGSRSIMRPIIKAMLKAGANPALRNKAGLTAAQVAREEGHNSTATLLDMLATKYAQTEESVLEVKDTLSTVVPSEEVADLEHKISSLCCSCNTCMNDMYV